MQLMYVFMYRCVKRSQENLHTNVWKTENNSQLRSKIHKYNTEVISGLKIFYVEISKNSFLTSSEPDITIVQIKLKPVLMPMMRNCEKSGAKGSSHEREPKTRS